MNKFLQIWIPFLIIGLSFVVFFKFGSVEKVGLAPVDGEQVAPQAASRLAVGQRFTSHAEMIDDQLAAGFVRVGSFGKQWPARVTEIVTGQDEIKFVRQDGTPHYYPDFDGYNMKMVRLLAGEQETIVVFRSAKKR